MRTTAADENRISGFYLQQWDEKQAQVMVHPLAVCRKLTADRAPIGRVIEFFDFGLNAGYQKHCQLYLCRHLRMVVVNLPLIL